MQKTDALTTFGQSCTQKYKTHDNSNLQPASGGQFTMAWSDQGHWLFQFMKNLENKRIRSVSVRVPKDKKSKICVFRDSRKCSRTHSRSHSRSFSALLLRRLADSEDAVPRTDKRCNIQKWSGKIRIN